MKQQLKKWMTAVVFTFLAISAFAQDDESPAAAPWVSDKGYWVLESNIHSPLNHIVRFYTNEDVLVYTENISGMRLNPDKRKVKMKLKEVLEATVLAWQKNSQPEANKDYVTAKLK